MLANKLRILFMFYGRFAPVSILLSLLSAYTIWNAGMGTVGVMFSFKVTTMAIIWWFVNAFSEKAYYFYYNSGLSKRTLWTFAHTFDMMTFIISVSVIICLT